MLRTIAYRQALTLGTTNGRFGYSTLSSALKLSSLPAPHTGNISIVSLNRPNARNAISRQLANELAQVVRSVEQEGGKGITRALILASASDESFCAGADLKERVGMSPDEVASFLTSLRNTFARLAALPIPTISAISSVAFGGGLELALCTNFRIMSSNATVALPETKLAIIPGAGGTFRLPALIGVNRARDLILTGRRVAGPEAYFLGICDRLVQANEADSKTPGVVREKVLAAAIALAQDICEGGPVGIRAAMQATANWTEGQQSENRAYEMVMPTQDRMEALKAFREKRKPVFRGQ